MPVFFASLFIVSCFYLIPGYYPANTIEMFEQLDFKHFCVVEWYNSKQMNTHV